ncbi:3234_t:CDS:2 [Funneliformis geosporum]|uniref:19533_t:CDS:1 n=1 Tax=Funneliformis geosporum TaxID=1117311 RepID=A0A9W4SXT8_9GLOM|nr:3234_t:CDS:2 [Funneliformis geosporum]CAI2184615.1 19533_t:CDS:2 [Funneliformis geosporum]
MSVATEGLEDMPIQVTRETRQASKINQIFAKIDDSLMQMQGQNIIKINIQDLEKCPPPNVYIEIVGRITNVQRTHRAVEFIGIALPNSTNRFHQNPFPGVFTVPATQQQNQRPEQAPYIINWDANQTLIYYIMK